MTQYLRGQVWFYRTDRIANGQIQGANRPVVIVSNDIGNAHAPILTVVPCTTAKKNRLPTHAHISLTHPSTAMCEQVQTVNKSDLTDYMQALGAKEMDTLDNCLSVAMGLNPIPQRRASV